MDIKKIKERINTLEWEIRNNEEENQMMQEEIDSLWEKIDGKIYAIGDHTNKHLFGDLTEKTYLKYVDEGKISTDGGQGGWSHNYISDDKYSEEILNKIMRG